MRIRTSRRTVRIAAVASAGVLTIMALAGCIKVDADVAIDSDAKGTGTFALELQKEAAGFLGISDLDTFSSQLTEGELSDSGVGALGSCEASENDTGFVYTCSFSGEDFTDPEGPWTITKNGDQIVFKMVNEGQSEGDTADASALLGDATLGSITVDVTFPGAITEVTGSAAKKTSDTTASVTGTLSTPIDVTITSAASSGGGFAGILVVLIALAVIALIIIVVVVLLMRRRKAPQDTAVAAAYTPDVAGTVAAGAGAAAAAPVVLDDMMAAPVTDATEVTDVIETPDTTEVIDVIETPDTTEVTDVIETPDTTEVTDVIETPDTTEVTDVIETPDTTEVTDVIETPDTTEVTDVIETPDTTEVTDVIETPDTTEVTDVIETPDTTEVTDVIETPDTTEVTDVIETPDVEASDTDGPTQPNA